MAESGSRQDNDGQDAEERGDRWMATDRYTRIILTVIAFSLSVIALRPFIAPGAAGAQISACGLDEHHPCYIAGWGPEGTVPIVNAGHFPLEVLVTNPSANPMPVSVVNPPMPLAHHH